MTDFNTANNRAVWFDIPVVDLDRAARFYTAVIGVDVQKEQFGDISFCILDHKDGNGGCLIVDPNAVSADHGVLVYLNVDGRIRDALDQVKKLGGKMIEDIKSLGQYGFRALVLDSEGNRIALHSNSDA